MYRVGKKGEGPALHAEARTEVGVHHLLPPPRDPELLSRLRAPSKYPRTSNRTKKYQSFISFAISNYQTS